MNHYLLNSFVAAGLVMFTSAFASDEGAKMDRQLCSVCHGPSGTTSSELFPQLAGEPAPYLISQMKAFRDKTRKDENARRFMWGISSRLSDEEIAQLASFYESSAPAHKGKVSDKIQYETGRNIFLNGNSDKSVPPCMACHGEKGEGKELTPRLGGQNRAYLVRQLRVFYGDERPAATAMHEIVKGLSDSDIESVAEYLHAQ